MIVETGVVVAGTGFAGAAVARDLFDPRNNAPTILVDKLHGEMIVDVILSTKGDVAGALVARRGQVEPLKTPVVVLATGNVSGLFPGGDWRASGDGLAIAHRAGLALTKPHVVGAELRAGVPCKADGSTAVAGLFVAGSLGSDRPDAAKVARAAIARSRQGVEPLGPYRVQPAIDSPLADGFADVKFDRLRSIMHRAVSGEGAVDAARMELHRLKGEADDYARARVDLQLFSLQNACEVGLLLLRG